MPVQVRALDDDEVLTQYGVVGEPFRNAPRWKTERELSLCAASHDTAASAICVTGRVRPGHDASRSTTAGSLRQVGFRVRHSPTRRNEHHVSVSFDGVWDDEMRKAFDEAFAADGEHDG